MSDRPKPAEEPKKPIPVWKIILSYLVGVVVLGISPRRDSIFATLYQWSILFVFAALFIYREGAPRVRRIFDGAILDSLFKNWATREIEADYRLSCWNPNALWPLTGNPKVRRESVSKPTPGRTNVAFPAPFTLRANPAINFLAFKVPKSN